MVEQDSREDGMVQGRNITRQGGGAGLYSFLISSLGKEQLFTTYTPSLLVQCKPANWVIQSFLKYIGSNTSIQLDKIKNRLQK